LDEFCKFHKQFKFKTVLRDIESGTQRMQEQGHLVYITAFAHNQGGLCTAKVLGKRLQYVAPKGADNFALTHMALPQSSDNTSMANAMKGLLSEVELLAAQTSEIDICTGEVTAIDMDQSNVTKLVTRSPFDRESDDNNHAVPINHGASLSLDMLSSSRDVSMEAMRRASLLAKERGQDSGEFIGNASDDFKDKILEFLGFTLSTLAPYAIVRQDLRGDGALFILSRSSWVDLVEVAKVGPHKSQDRQMLAIWGEINGSDENVLSVKALTSRIEKLNTLDRCMDLYGDAREGVTVILIADPSGDTLPRDFVSHCRKPLWGRSDAAVTHLAAMRLSGHDELLAAGRSAGFGTQSVIALNLDRDETEPTT